MKSCAGSGGITLGAGAGVGDGRVGAVDIDAEDGDDGTFIGIGEDPPVGIGDDDMPYGAGGDDIA